MLRLGLIQRHGHSVDVRFFLIDMDHGIDEPFPVFVLQPFLRRGQPLTDSRTVGPVETVARLDDKPVERRFVIGVDSGRGQDRIIRLSVGGV